MSYGLRCAHCYAKVRIRTSTADHLLLRTAYLQCTNEACGAAYRASFEVTHLLSPPAIYNPAINLPMAPSAMRREARGGDPSQQFDLYDDEDDIDTADETNNKHGAAQ